MLDWLFYILTGLLGLSFFTSKSGIAISGWLLLITSLFLMPWRQVNEKDSWVLITAALFPLAIFFNLFSLGGAHSAAHTASSLGFILFVPIFYVLLSNKKAKRIFEYTSLVSIVVASCYSVFLLFHEHHGVFTGSQRVASFFDVSRWGLFSAIAIIALYIAFLNTRSSLGKFVLFCILILTAFAFTISSSRAPMIGILISLVFLGVIAPKSYFKGLLVIGILGGIILLFSPGLMNRVESIGAVSTTADGELSSTNSSNAGRLYMWKVASDFWKEQPLLGTGMENTREPLKNFLTRQTDEYRQKYVIHNFSYNDQHSSYLNILVQFGLIYFIIFFGVIGWVLYKAWDLKKIRSSPERQFAWSGVICFLVVGIFYGEIISFGSIMFWPLIPLLFYEEQLVQN